MERVGEAGCGGGMAVAASPAVGLTLAAALASCAALFATLMVWLSSWLINDAQNICALVSIVMAASISLTVSGWSFAPAAGWRVRRATMAEWGRVKEGKIDWCIDDSGMSTAHRG